MYVCMYVCISEWLYVSTDLSDTVLSLSLPPPPPPHFTLPLRHIPVDQYHRHPPPPRERKPKLPPTAIHHGNGRGQRPAWPRILIGGRETTAGGFMPGLDGMGEKR